jgi:replicative DNA helicase
MFIDDMPAMTIDHIKREARNLAKTGPIGCIAVDYLTLMEAKKAERNDLAYGEITKALKNLAKELNCYVLLLTQLNRKLEDRSDKRPMPSDSRDTGQIEQDCDMWIGLYRHGVYDDTCKHKGLTEGIVRLNRHGQTGTFYMDLKDGYFVPLSNADGEYMKSENDDGKKDGNKGAFNQ